MNQFIAFSGGKDSTALALLCPDATPVFTDTGWEFPHVYEHIARFENVTGRAVVRIINERDGTLPNAIRRRRFMPNHGARFCTLEFKIDPYNRYIKRHLPAELLIGLRADEPERTGNTTEMDGLTVRYPLREMGLTQLDVVQICADADLLPRYPVYAARGGCIGCFYKRKAEVQAMIALVPELVDELQALEGEVQDERGRFFHMFPSVGMSIADLRRQPMLFEPDEVYAAAGDSSDVGAACGLFCNR